MKAAVGARKRTEGAGATQLAAKGKGPLWEVYSHRIEGRILQRPDGTKGVILTSKYHDWAQHYATVYLVRWDHAAKPCEVPGPDVEAWVTDVFANETWVPKKIRAAQLNGWHEPPLEMLDSPQLKVRKKVADAGPSSPLHSPAAGAAASPVPPGGEASARNKRSSTSLHRMEDHDGADAAGSSAAADVAAGGAGGLISGLIGGLQHAAAAVLSPVKAAVAAAAAGTSAAAGEAPAAAAGAQQQKPAAAGIRIFAAGSSEELASLMAGLKEDNLFCNKHVKVSRSNNSNVTAADVRKKAVANIRAARTAYLKALQQQQQQQQPAAAREEEEEEAEEEVEEVEEEPQEREKGPGSAKKQKQGKQQQAAAGSSKKQRGGAAGSSKAAPAEAAAAAPASKKGKKGEKQQAEVKVKVDKVAAAAKGKAKGSGGRVKARDPFENETEWITSWTGKRYPASICFCPGDKRVDELAEEDTADGEYEVERIIDDMTSDGATFYLVKWKGYELNVGSGTDEDKGDWVIEADITRSNTAVMEWLRKPKPRYYFQVALDE